MSPTFIQRACFEKSTHTLWYKRPVVFRHTHTHTRTKHATNKGSNSRKTNFQVIRSSWARAPQHIPILSTAKLIYWRGCLKLLNGMETDLEKRRRFQTSLTPGEWGIFLHLSPDADCYWPSSVAVWGLRVRRASPRGHYLHRHARRS